MVTEQHTIARQYGQSLSHHKRYGRLIMPLLLLGWVIADPAVMPLIAATLADAYIAVGVFVAATLFVYYFVENYYGFDITTLEHKHPIYQISIVAILGALPGCGGAIIVVSQYAAGRLGFAALVTVLVATMGDAAFLLLAKSPQTGFLVLAVGLIVGIVSGLLIHAFHSPDFLRKPRISQSQSDNACIALPPIAKPLGGLWSAVLIIAFPLTILSSFQIEPAPITAFGTTIDITQSIGVTGALLCLATWALLPLRAGYHGLVAEDRMAADNTDTTDNVYSTHNNPTFTQDTHRKTTLLSTVIHDTNFIMVWVTAAFLLFELIVHYTGLDIGLLFKASAWLAPMIGVMVGFLPGCGPQIIIAGLYLQGVAPLSTLLGNAISNDGDALFPAIALAPKAAIIATLYSAIPAILVAYTVHYFMT